jgi:phosphotransferase system  glucose/maltose/N-acetylglucosamine-specific IIC component
MCRGHLLDSELLAARLDDWAGAVANFLFIPYYPFWSLLIIALDVLVVWAIAAHGP